MDDSPQTPPRAEEPLGTPVPEQLGEWRPALDVIEVMRAPKPGARAAPGVPSARPPAG